MDKNHFSGTISHCLCIFKRNFRRERDCLRLAGFNFNDGMGGGDILKSNIIFNMVRETQDHGTFNSWWVPFRKRSAIA